MFVFYITDLSKVLIDYIRGPLNGLIVFITGPFKFQRFDCLYQGSCKYLNVFFCRGPFKDLLVFIRGPSKDLIVFIRGPFKHLIVLFKDPYI